ncbi:NAD(P)/FAD-dependent oxidoreductase [Patescibacteria group bacterium]|nr:NAD(P)/FAD-dependent oxidoreductase [Patescibacteria group bacterium]
MMAAGRAAELGARVVLVEKNSSLGKKIAITGKGRCNIAQAEFELRPLVEAYGKNGKFLFSVFNIFGPKQTMVFFEDRGLKLKTERGGRVFPVSDSAHDVIDILVKYMRDNGVKIFRNAEVVSLEMEGDKISEIVLKDETIAPKNIVICTGGKSYPGTGSTGDGYKWAEKMGHTLVPARPALVPIRVGDSWVKQLQGLSLKNVELSAWQGGKKKDTRFGEMLFTHFGISGPIVLDLSRKIGELLDSGEVLLSLDLKPALTDKMLDERIQRDFKKYQNKLFKNALDDLLPQKMISVIIEKSGISSEKQVNEVTREERKHLVDLLKKVEMKASGLVGFENAIVTSGGVNLKEVDPKTMKSKIIDNLYFAGEVLDLDGPTGGYNLQVAWSTGFVAGEAAVNI